MGHVPHFFYLPHFTTAPSSFFHLPDDKAALQKELGLSIRDDVPLIGFIGRLDAQKGVNLIASGGGCLCSKLEAYNQNSELEGYNQR
ncbi:hypothetical protein L2E82_11690 [Cichorium intybus]|uniref:Uncharacterized protein n=1 Tax=Cichorium intybus TaxID=13427 RepID=A0ACB9GF60_CICIN|nr:hypothetical protein L2E82_11690 [Cichorium intybus]